MSLVVIAIFPLQEYLLWAPKKHIFCSFKDFLIVAWKKKKKLLGLKAGILVNCEGSLKSLNSLEGGEWVFCLIEH